MSSNGSLMPLKTYTTIWNADKKLYRFQDINLPMPISFRQIGLFGIGAILWFPLMGFLHIPITVAWGAIIWGSVPVGLAVLSDKPIFGGKTVLQAAMTWMRYLSTPAEYRDMVPVKKKEAETDYSVVAKVWTSAEEYQRSFTPKTRLDESKMQEALFAPTPSHQNVSKFFSALASEPDHTGASR